MIWRLPEQIDGALRMILLDGGSLAVDRENQVERIHYETTVAGRQQQLGFYERRGVRQREARTSSSTVSRSNHTNSQYYY